LLKALGSTDSYIATGASVALTTLVTLLFLGWSRHWVIGNWGPRIVEVLKGLNWKPATDEETVGLRLLQKLGSAAARLGNSQKDAVGRSEK
jgi:hypothetical protein